MTSIINVVADIGSIITAMVALWAWYRFRDQSKSRQQRLEEYLLEVKADPTSGEGLKTVPHLMARLYMTETQVYEAAFNSDAIRALPREGKDGLATQVMFQHNPDGRAKQSMT